MAKLTQNTTWLYVSIALYVILIAFLACAIILNFLYINGAPEPTCPDPNACPPCTENVCQDLNATNCFNSDQTLTSLTNPNPVFEFNLLGSVAQNPSLGTEGNIGSFQQAFSNTILTTVNSQNYYSMKNLLDSSVSRFRFSEQRNTIVEQTQGFTLLVNTTAIQGTIYPLVISTQNTAGTTKSGIINYVGGTVVLTVPPDTYYLYLASSDTDVLSLGLQSGVFVPTWNTEPVPGVNDTNYNKYIWTFYQVI